MTQRLSCLLGLTFGLLALFACREVPPGWRANHSAIPGPALIDAEVRRLMQQEDVKGLALAVIDGGRIVHLAAHGMRNVERRLPLRTDTVMYGASLTKTAVAYLVLQLVDEGRIGLDDSVAALLPEPLPAYEDYGDLVEDERWRALTPRILLEHASGFPNFRWLEPDQKLRFRRDPGERYGYSGEGFYVLQTVLEDGLGLDLGREMERRLFEPFGMSRTSMAWRADFAANLADGYRLDGSFEQHDERSRPSAAGSMDTTIADQAKLWAAILRGDGLSVASRAELVRPQIAITSAAQFPTLQEGSDPRGPEINLAAGLGLVTFENSTGRAWFKGGHNDSTGNMVVCQEQGQRGIVLLSNSVRAERIYPALVRYVLGTSAMPWWWEYGETGEQ